MFPVEKCMKQECRLRVFENRVLRRIFGPKRDEVTGGREKHMSSLMNFTKYSGDQIEKHEIGWACNIHV
jgi:hypothetical protein